MPSVLSGLTLSVIGRANYSGFVALAVLMGGAPIAGLVCGFYLAWIQTAMSLWAKISVGIVSAAVCAAAAFALGWGSMFAIAVLLF